MLELWTSTRVLDIRAVQGQSWLRAYTRNVPNSEHLGQ